MLAIDYLDLYIYVYMCMYENIKSGPSVVLST